MEWTAPYLLATGAFLAVVLLWFVAMMILTGRRHRKAAGSWNAGPDLDPADLSHEEFGLLASGERRLIEVALLRLCLEGHVKEDGVIVLVDDPGDTAAESSHLGRQAVVNRLRGKARALLTDVVYAARRRTDFSAAWGRLVALGLVNERAAKIVRTRVRVIIVYAVLIHVAFVAGAIGHAVAMPDSVTNMDKSQMVGAIMAVVLMCALVSAIASKHTGGRLDSNTPAGRELLARAQRQDCGPSEDRMLRRVALHGFSAVPRFAEAAQYADLDSEQSDRQKRFSQFADIFSTVTGIFGPGGGSEKR